MPPLGPLRLALEQSGRAGEDWKWRKAGRSEDGVEGMRSLTGFVSLLAGVAIVRLRLDGRLLGGVGGLINSGEGGAELVLSSGATTIGAGAWLRRLLKEEAVLMPRFFKFRGFLAGVVGRCSSKKVLADASPETGSVLRDRKSATKEQGVMVFAKGDSGDTPGEGSVTEDESIVEMVVVGELSEEAVELLSRLSRWRWKEENGVPGFVFPLVCGRAGVVPFTKPWPGGAEACCSEPKTAPNEGMGMGRGEGALGCTMLGAWRASGVASLVQRLAASVAQRRAWSGVDGGMGQCAKDCSSFLAGKEGLGVGEALFSEGRSALRSREVVAVGEADTGEQEEEVAVVSRLVECIERAGCMARVRYGRSE